MSQPQITINFSFTVTAQEIPALVEKITSMFPAGVATAGSSLQALAHTWPPVPATAGAAYQALAEENLRQLREGAVPDNGWGGVRDLEKVIGSLRSETRRVVMCAIENGGHITREQVYELLGRDKDQSLKGFTKPVASLMERLVASGELSTDAKPLLSPIYQKSKTYQQAQGFAVPVQVVSLMSRSTLSL